MTCHRRYTFLYPETWDLGGYSKILARLQAACEEFWWFEEPVINGEEDMSLEFSFTVSARDGWWAHQRAMNLAVHCFYVMGLDEQYVPVPTWVKLPPHTNRGRYRVLAQ